MNGIATKKVSGGKLLRVKSVFGEQIESVQLTGDFFLHPEEGVNLLEKSLQGLSVSRDPEVFLKHISEALQKNNIQLIGISPEDIVETLIQSFHIS